MDPQQSALRMALSLPTRVIPRLAGPPPTIEGRTLDPRVHLMLRLSTKIGINRPHDVDTRRVEMRKNTALIMPAVNGVDASEHLLADRIPARVYRAQGVHGEQPGIMYLHGGGWVVGDLDTHDGTCRMLALHSGCVVISVDYRLAPEHQFPAGLQDAIDAFEYIQDRPGEFGIIPGAVAVSGDSAGANLASALCLSHEPLAAALVYPGTDLRMGQASVSTFGEGFLLTRDDMFWYREQYLPDLAQATDPLVSPLLAEDLSHFPPTAIWTAGFDPLHDEGEAFAKRLRESGVEVRYTCLRDQIHGFFGMGLLPGGMERIAEVCRETGRLVHDAMA